MVSAFDLHYLYITLGVISQPHLAFSPTSVSRVLGRHGNAYLLVGGCWLVDSKFQRSDEINVRFSCLNFHEDPGWSTIMHGITWEGWDEAKLETFRII